MQVLAVTLTLLTAQTVLDSDVPDYRPAATLKGTLTFGPDGGYEALLGSWVQRMKSYYPDLRGLDPDRSLPPSVPQALTTGAARCGLMSRPLTARERSDYQDMWGDPPVDLIVGADAAAVVVHQDNPLAGLKADDLAALFSSTARRAIRSWGDVGLGDGWKGKPVHLYILKAGLLAREVFAARALQGAAVHPDVKELEGSAAVVRAVADDPLGVGVVALSAKAMGVRVVPLKSPEGTEYTRDEILSLAHPLAWQIHLPYRAVRREPLDPVLREFFTLILSRDGQSIVADAGYVPISGPMARKQTKLLK